MMPPARVQGVKERRREEGGRGGVEKCEWEKGGKDCRGRDQEKGKNGKYRERN